MNPPKITKIDTDKRRRKENHPKWKGKARSNQFLIKSNMQHVLGDCTVHSEKATWH
jgi:hypothetical protein